MLIPTKLENTRENVADLVDALMESQDYLNVLAVSPESKDIAKIAGDLTAKEEQDVRHVLEQAEMLFVSRTARSALPPHFAIRTADSGTDLLMYIAHCDAGQTTPSRSTVTFDMRTLSELLEIEGITSISLPSILENQLAPANAGSKGRWEPNELRAIE